MPRGHGVEHEDQIGVLEVRREVREWTHPAVQRMPPREVHEARVPALEDGRAQELGERDQMLDRAYAASDFFRHDDRPPGLGERTRELLDRGGLSGGSARWSRAGSRSC